MHFTKLAQQHRCYLYSPKHITPLYTDTVVISVEKAGDTENKKYCTGPMSNLVGTCVCATLHLEVCSFQMALHR